MPQTAALARNAAPGRYPIGEFLATIAGIEATTGQLSFKHKVDPLGLLNPGKMRTAKNMT